MLYLQRFGPDSDESLPPIPFKSDDEHPFYCTRNNWKTRSREVNCQYYGHCWNDGYDKEDDDDVLPF
jgi:hypothetical protein